MAICGHTRAGLRRESRGAGGEAGGGGESGTHLDGFKDIWELINGPDSWANNPFVWAITFRRVTP